MLASGRREPELRVLSIFHGGRDQALRARERALVNQGLEVKLITPDRWKAVDNESTRDSLDIVELPVIRPGDVNRHRYRDARRIQQIVQSFRPDVIDLHEEPFSAIAAQVMRSVPSSVPVVGYTAQNLDKRFPPPFAQIERASFARLVAMYPCSRQAASVVRGKGYRGLVTVVPLGYDSTHFYPSEKSRRPHEALCLVWAGRLVREKGISDTVDALVRLQRDVLWTLHVVGDGPEAQATRDQVSQHGLTQNVIFHGNADAPVVGKLMRDAHIVLMPSRSTPSWVEQFGRVAVEAMASGAVVVAYGTGSLPEVLGDSGCLVNEGDINGLATTLRLLASDADRWAQLRGRAISRSARYRWETIAHQLAAVFESACDALPQHPSRSTAQSRRSAVEEFGPTAASPVGRRPFAFPLLRRGGIAAAVMARLLDELRGDG